MTVGVVAGAERRRQHREVVEEAVAGVVATRAIALGVAVLAETVAAEVGGDDGIELTDVTTRHGTVSRKIIYSAQYDLNSTPAMQRTFDMHG